MILDISEWYFDPTTDLQLILAGINGILNFSPLHIHVPDCCRVENVDFSIKVNILGYHISSFSTWKKPNNTSARNHFVLGIYYFVVVSLVVISWYLLEVISLLGLVSAARSGLCLGHSPSGTLPEQACSPKVCCQQTAKWLKVIVWSVVNGCDLIIFQGANLP